MPIIVDLEGGSGGAEGFILDPDGAAPLNLGNNGPLRLAALTATPAPKLPQWQSNADTDGAALVRNPYHDKRDWQMQVRVTVGGMDQAMASIGILEGKLQEACLQGAGNGPGLAFDWTPAGAGTTLRGYMLLGQITDLPVTYDDGWFAAMPILTVPFTSKPFLYGEEVSAGSVTSSSVVAELVVDDVAGDVPAEARLVVTDESSEARRWVEWGLESFYFDSVSPSELFIDSASLVTSGFAGSSTALSGAYGGSAISTSLLSQPTAVCGTGDQPHIGTYRVKARVWSASANEYWRLTWQDGDGPFGSNQYAQPIAGSAFNELDLGLITVEVAEAGDQAWSGRIEAWTSASGSEVGAVDYLFLVPAAEGYGRLEGNYVYATGAITGFDDFSTLASGTALNGHAAIDGGTWATSGTTTDFTGAGPVGSWAPAAVQRDTSSQPAFRYAILGSSTPTDVEVGVALTVPVASALIQYEVLARWTDANNYLALTLNPEGSISLVTCISGSLLELGLAGFDSLPAPGQYALRLVAYASGHALGWLFDSTGTTTATVEAFSSTLATGGALASGKSGFADLSNYGVAEERYYSNFYIAAPATEPLVVNASKSIEIRSDANLRESSDGTRYGKLPSRGSWLWVPQAGDAGRSTRIAVRATREDPVTSASRNDGDSITAQVYVTPRFLAVPRG